MPRHKRTDTDRAAQFVCKHMPDAFPNGWLIDDLLKLFKEARRDERKRVLAGYRDESRSSGHSSEGG